jgi:hypothetical protein
MENTVPDLQFLQGIGVDPGSSGAVICAGLDYSLRPDPRKELLDLT